MRWVLLGSIVIALGGACGPGKGGGTAEDGTTSVGATTGVVTTGGTDATTSGTGPVPSCPDVEMAGSSGGAVETCPEHPVTDACCCFVFDPQWNAVATVCGVKELCPTILLDCSDPFLMDCPIEELTVLDEQSIDCALQALSEGTTSGRISWSVGFGSTQQHMTLDLVGDGTVMSQGVMTVDLVNSFSAVERRLLPQQQFFVDCLAEPAWRTRFECIRQALTCSSRETCLEGFDCSPPPETCDGGNGLR